MDRNGKLELPMLCSIPTYPVYSRECKNLGKKEEMGKEAFR